MNRSSSIRRDFSDGGSQEIFVETIGVESPSSEIIGEATALFLNADDFAIRTTIGLE